MLHTNPKIVSTSGMVGFFGFHDLSYSTFSRARKRYGLA